MRKEGIPLRLGKFQNHPKDQLYDLCWQKDILISRKFVVIRSKVFWFDALVPHWTPIILSKMYVRNNWCNTNKFTSKNLHGSSRARFWTKYNRTWKFTIQNINYGNQIRKEIHVLGDTF